MPAFAMLALQYGPALIQAGIDMVPILTAAFDIANTGREPTADEWALLDSHTSDDLADLVKRAKDAQAA